MQQFKIRQDGFREIKKQFLLRIVPIMLIAVTAGIVISSINSQHKKTDVNVLPFIIPFMAAAVGFGLYRGINRQKILFESFTLTITNNMIMREQLNTPGISIYLNNVKEILKHKNGGFVIKGDERTNIIYVPAQIDNYPELETRLNEIRPVITKKADTALQKYQWLASLLVIGLMVCVYTVTNKIVVAVSGTLLIAFMLWCFYEVRTSKNIDAKTKRNIWWVLVVLVSVIAVMIMKLSSSVKQ